MIPPKFLLSGYIYFTNRLKNNYWSLINLTLHFLIDKSIILEEGL